MKTIAPLAALAVALSLAGLAVALPPHVPDRTCTDDYTFCYEIDRDEGCVRTEGVLNRNVCKPSPDVDVGYEWKCFDVFSYCDTMVRCVVVSGDVNANTCPDVGVCVGHYQPVGETCTIQTAPNVAFYRCSGDAYALHLNNAQSQCMRIPLP